MRKILIFISFLLLCSTLFACGGQPQKPVVDISSPATTAEQALAYMDAQLATLHVNGSISVTFE